MLVFESRIGLKLVFIVIWPEGSSSSYEENTSKQCVVHNYGKSLLKMQVIMSKISKEHWISTSPSDKTDGKASRVGLNSWVSNKLYLSILPILFYRVNYMSTLSSSVTLLHRIDHVEIFYPLTLRLFYEGLDGGFSVSRGTNKLSWHFSSWIFASLRSPFLLNGLPGCSVVLFILCF